VVIITDKGSSSGKGVIIRLDRMIQINRSRPMTGTTGVEMALLAVTEVIVDRGESDREVGSIR
jgi:hypothetical protein